MNANSSAGNFGSYRTLTHEIMKEMRRRLTLLLRLRVIRKDCEEGVSRPSSRDPVRFGFGGAVNDDEQQHASSIRGDVSGNNMADCRYIFTREH